MSAVEGKLGQEGRGTEAAVQVISMPAIDDEELPDGGLRAWLVVVGCFFVNAVVVGFW